MKSLAFRLMTTALRQMKLDTMLYALSQGAIVMVAGIGIKQK
jgi:hypothetical protein